METIVQNAHGTVPVEPMLVSRLDVDLVRIASSLCR